MFADEELLQLTQMQISLLAGRKLNRQDREKARVVEDIAGRLAQRQLFVRSFVFARNMLDDPYRQNSEQQIGLEKLIRETRSPELRSKLTNKLAQELRLVCKTLGKSELLKSFRSALESYIWIDPPSPPDQGGKIPHAFLISEQGRLIKFREDSAEMRAWADAYQWSKDTGYVFTPEEISPYVFIAAEKVIRTKYGVRIPASMHSYAKQSHCVINEIRNTLSKQGYYTNLPHDLRPKPARLETADVEPALTKFVKNWVGYSGPTTSKMDSDEPILHVGSIEHWLQQFESEDLVDAALRVLHKVKLIGRQETTVAVKQFLNRNPEFSNSIVCPFGTPRDSSAINTYYVGDLNLEIISLEKGLGGNQPILFVDDFIGTGDQAILQLETWLGKEPTVSLREDRGEALPSDLRNKLNKRRFAIIFAAGLDQGQSRLTERIDDLGLNGKVHVQIRENGLPKAFNGVNFKSKQQEDQFREFCSRVGRALLADQKKKASDDWLNKRTLGYGNHALLVVFPNNTPSQTLTCLWERGRVDGVPWVPLFPRRPKP